MKAIGTIAYVTKGLYDTSVTYKEMEIVLHNGSLWEPKKETTGNAPPDYQKNEDGTPAENEFWKLFLPGALGDDYVKKTDIAKAPTETEPGNAGVVMPDGKTIRIGEGGLLTGTPLDFMGTWKELQGGLESGEITEGMMGYIDGTSEDPENPDPDHPNNMLFKFDDFFSLHSSNAVQNFLITDALNKMNQLIEEVKGLRASIESFGLSKIAPADLTDVTEDNGMVLGAFEKNASVQGSLANEMRKIKVKSRVCTKNMQIPEGSTFYEEYFQIPEDILETYICCVPQEIWPLDSWNAAYPRMNIVSDNARVLINITGPRSGNFRVSFLFLYYENG